MTALLLAVGVPLLALYLAAWAVHVDRDGVHPLRAFWTVIEVWRFVWRRLRD